MAREMPPYLKNKFGMRPLKRRVNRVTKREGESGKHEVMGKRSLRFLRFGKGRGIGLPGR